MACAANPQFLCVIGVDSHTPSLSKGPELPQNGEGRAGCLQVTSRGHPLRARNDTSCCPHAHSTVSIPAAVGERRPEVIWEMLPHTEGSKSVSVNIKRSGSAVKF